MTLLSKITNEAINENLEKRWKNAEIYVCFPLSSGLLQICCDDRVIQQVKPSLCSVGNLLPSFIDLYWTCLDFCQSLQGSWYLYRGRPKKLPWKELVGGDNLQHLDFSSVLCVLINILDAATRLCHCRIRLPSHEQLQGKPMYYHQVKVKTLCVGEDFNNGHNSNPPSYNPIPSIVVNQVLEKLKLQRESCNMQLLYLVMDLPLSRRSRKWFLLPTHCLRVLDVQRL